MRPRVREPLRVLAHTVLFTALHLMSAELDRALHTPRDTLIAFAYGWLLLACTRVVWGILEGLWRRMRWSSSAPESLWTIMRHQFSLADAMRAAGLHAAEEKAEALRRLQSALSFCEEEEEAEAEDAAPRLADAGKWALAHVGGAGLFVLSYSLSGLFWLPQQAGLLAVLWTLLLVRSPAHAFASRGGRRLRSRAFGAGLLLATVVAGVRLVWLDPRTEWGQAAPHLWLGVLLPAGTLAAGLWWADTPSADVARAAWVTLGMPSLTVLSVTVLSLLTLSPAYSSSKTRIEEELANATRAYYDASTRMYTRFGVSALPIPDTNRGLLALALVPTLIWLSVHAVLHSVPERVGSTVVAYMVGMGGEGVWLTAPLLLCALVLVGLPELRTLEERELKQRGEVALYSQDMLVMTTQAAAKEEDAEAPRPCP